MSHPSPPPPPRDLYAHATEGTMRAAYLGVMHRLRDGFDGTGLLAAWDRAAQQRPRAALAHLRTLLGVHRADDLVALDLPWWTYRAIDTVTGFLAASGGRARVFEYGSGASTVWLARRAATVTSIEHHPAWAAHVREMLAAQGHDNAVVHHVPARASTAPAVASGAPSGTGLDFAEYVAAIDAHPGPYDLVVVDGRARGPALVGALQDVAEDGMAVLDDAQRTRYQPWLDRARAAGWDVERHRGTAPCEPLPRDTATLTRA